MAFGDFTSICAQAALPVCNLLGPPTTLTTTQQPLLVPTCQARSIEFANTIIFQAATDFAHIAALMMTTIMILHVRSKFTAVGRKEILTFFYIYLILTCVSLVLDAGVIGATNAGAYPWAVAVQNGLASALCVSLLINGFVGFQIYEDGTTLSVWLLRVTALGMFVISFAVSLLTFKGWGGLGPQNTIGLFVVVYIFSALCIGVYVIMQIVLVTNTLQDRWPLGDLLFGVFFLVVGQVLLYILGTTICENTSHYLDPLFFATVCNLLAVMMVYKYWDSITKEDLEFSVGTKQGNWESAVNRYEDDSYSDYNQHTLSKRQSFYDGHGSFSKRASLYDMSASSLDYNPRPASSHHYVVGGANNNNNNGSPRLAGHGYAQMIEGRQSYGDVRKSANIVNAPQIRASSQVRERNSVYDDERVLPGQGYAPQQVRDRSKGRHGRVTSNEVVYDRY